MACRCSELETGQPIAGALAQYLAGAKAGEAGRGRALVCLPAFIDYAFERFRRANVGRSREEGGSGLGLAVVQATLRRMVARRRPGIATAVVPS